MLSKIIKTLAEITIRNSLKTTCYGWSYQPKIPKNISKFKK